MQKKWGWQCRYVQQYNAIGEAPEEVRQVFQQRSRWCKGHFQTFWSSQCPLVDRRLGIMFQLCYSSTCLSYISAGVFPSPRTAVTIPDMRAVANHDCGMNGWTMCGVLVIDILWLLQLSLFR